MKLEHICGISVTWDELKDILADHVDKLANQQVEGSARSTELRQIAKTARGEHSYAESTLDGVVLVVDGVAYTEELWPKS